jgi:hypothetical protein
MPPDLEFLTVAYLPVFSVVAVVFLVTLAVG